MTASSAETRTVKTPDELKAWAADVAKKNKEDAPVVIRVSMGTCGIAAGTTPILEALKEQIKLQGKEGTVKITQTGCMGLCHSEPSVEVVDVEKGTSTFYGSLTAEQAPALIQAGTDLAPGVKVVDKIWYFPEEEENTNGAIQARVVLRNSGRIRPELIEDYIGTGGYSGLAKALTEMSSQDVIDTVTESGLRGRGGGGFPTGRKWAFAAAQNNEQKYVICNADEGDPGAFMDRAVLEGDPHAVLEAMAVAGYAVGANQGVIYIRAEYPLAIERLQIAIAQARECGFLGTNIFGSGFNFDIDIKYGAGAFVCGEETALIHSIEGKRGEPIFKPPFPAIEGLWKKPTIVNNVETYANVCAIMRKGAAWFKSIGTEKCPGTKVFALAGKIKNVGLVEVPMGTQLRDIIYKIGDGIKDGKAFKAVQTGGPSGGCITAAHLDSPIDYESLRALGSMMGSGGMIVMDEDDCMVNVAKYFLEFTLDESCGRCTPCRIGNKRLFEMLSDICHGKGTMETLIKLRTLSETIKDTALCGLGQTSPNPVLSTLREFRREYLEHVLNKTCSAGVCSSLIKFEINDKCVGCTMCARNCPANCITGEKKGKHVIDQNACIKCGVCYETCKFHAIDKK
ncbi:MAG: NADH-quinone oxidoreductase subunit NuoF [Planctomycetes bacterium]|nr:NADH-quinone oxidoreductase subunit NuoF [Planctomycetota bacterium]